MAGFLEFLTQGSPPPQSSTSVDQVSNVPAWYAQYAQGLTNYAAQAAAQPFQAYTGPRVAGLTNTQQQSQQYGQQHATDWQPYMQQAGQATQAGSQPFSQEGLNTFMNPYTNSVVNEMARLGNQNFFKNILPGVNQSFVGSGGFGGSRNMDMAERAARDFQANLTGQQAGALQSGFNTAMSNYGNWQDRYLTAGQDFSNLAKTQQQADIGTTSALGALGQQQQELEQKSLDTAYQDFLEQRNYPWAQVGNFQSVLQGTQPQGAGALQTTTGPYSGSSMSPSPLSILAGLYTLNKGATTGANP